MRTDKTEWLYKCVVTAAIIEATVVPLFGFIVGSDYHKPSLVAAPAFTEQPRVATAIVQEIGATSANCSNSRSRH
jgi:hypothetical protein